MVNILFVVLSMQLIHTGNVAMISLQPIVFNIELLMECLAIVGDWTLIRCAAFLWWVSNNQILPKIWFRHNFKNKCPFDHRTWYYSQTCINMSYFGIYVHFWKKIYFWCFFGHFLPMIPIFLTKSSILINLTYFFLRFDIESQNNSSKIYIDIFWIFRKYAF